ncbi:MAG TPA: class I SAM-dependent methyltransferase [Caulobacteraceae bacterium]
MGPGGLFLAARMLREVAAAPTMRIMDLGCGRGATSVFLAERLDATIHSVDLWNSAEERLALIERHGLQDRITPLQLDVTRRLPFAAGYFDLIFCMDAFHYFGARRGVLARLAGHLKPGGQLVVGNPCFDRELKGAPPAAYVEPWASEFSKYHSPAWWGRRLRGTGLFADVRVQEAEDGKALWDDDLLYDLEHDAQPRDLAADAEQILLGREQRAYPCLTHLVLAATTTYPQTPD